MRIEVIEPHGFCAGVERALKMAQEALSDGGQTIYGLHEIVHNELVVQDLVARGMRFVESVEEVPAGAIMLISTLGEELLTKGVLHETIRGRRGRLWATAAVTLMFFLIGGGLGGTVISGANVALLGLLCCLLYDREGLWTPVLFRWGWSFAAVFLLGQGGGSHALLRLYGVSEGLFTGGDAGFAYGLAWTLILIGLIASMLYTEKKKG